MTPSEQRIYRTGEIEKEVIRFNNSLLKFKALSRKFAWYRLTVFFTSVLVFLLFFFFVSGLSALASAAIFIAGFGLLVMAHNKIDFAIKRFTIWIKHKNENIARIKVDWENIPFNIPNASDDTHNFESDLNISGKHSLMHLINLSLSNEGTQKLREWLTVPVPDIKTIENRQSLIKEIIPLKRFRAKLQLNSGLTYTKKSEINSALILKETCDLYKLKKVIYLLSGIIFINIILFLLFLFTGFPPYFAAGLLIQLAVYWFNSGKLESSFEKATAIEEILGKFSRILEFLEKYPYRKNSLLEKLCSPFLEKGSRPSHKFKQINRTILALSMSKNPFTELLFNTVFPWDFYHVYKLENYKKDIAEKLPLWLDIWFELEALISLTNLAYIYPDYTFPSVNETTKTVNNVFVIKEAGHPLIPHNQCIRNDFLFNNIGESVIITGSNMSGKSTFLKTIGINLALCYSGAPVCASSMETSLFRIFTCIKVGDSVTDGISYFYAEVKRLKLLLNELNKANNYPLLYLIDEIFRGTNNLERLSGSKAFIKALAGSKSIGLISTHDLELVKLENEIENIRNYHFREEIAADRMKFDYKIHKGPCPTTNALKIMQLEGLPV
jgi:ABC-type multidrug transport system fused ATPase/permease subunit